jgi:ATP-dependent Lon protease
LASFNLDEYREERSQFSSEEWVDLLIRSVGLEKSNRHRPDPQTAAMKALSLK